MYALIRGKGRHIHTHTLYIPWRVERRKTAEDDDVLDLVVVFVVGIDATGRNGAVSSVQWKDDDCRVRSTSPEAPGRDYRVVRQRQRQSKARSGAGNWDHRPSVWERCGYGGDAQH
jgi:hypothetical protein